MADFWDDFDKQESGYGMSRSGDFWSGLNETEVTPPKPSSNPVRRLVADPLVGLAKGAAVGIPETVVGLLDIPTMGHAGKVAETVSRGLGLGDFKSANEMFDNLLTPETREAQQKVAEAKGFLPTIATAIQNPSSIVQTVAESIPAMVTGMRVAGGIAKLAGKPLVEAGVANLPRIAKVGGIAEGAITAGQNIEQTRQQTEEGLLTPSQVAINILSGVLTGMIGVAGGKLAQRFGLEDVDTLFTGGRSGIVGDKEKGIFKKILYGAFQEGVLEELPQSMQEQIAQNLALNKPIDDGVFEAGAMGMLAGFAQSTGANIAGSTMRKMKNELDPINQTIKKLVDETLPGELNAIGGWDNGNPAENLTPTAVSETPHILQPSDINYGEEIYIPPPAPTEPPPESFSTGLQGVARELNIGQPAQLTPEEVMVTTSAPIAPEKTPAPEQKVEAPAPENVFSRMPDDQLKSMADNGVQGAKDERFKRNNFNVWLSEQTDADKLRQLRADHETEGNVVAAEQVAGRLEELGKLHREKQVASAPEVSKGGEQELITEARKYKTAEEFVKAQGEPLYHSTRTENIPSINQKGFTGDIGEMSGKTGGKMEKGVFLYGDKESADIFGKNFKDSSTVEVKVNGKIYDANSESKYGWEDDLQIQEIAKDKKIINQLRKDGYVGVNSVELGTPATFVFEPKTIKTKSQLTSIWNKAQEGKVETPKAEIPKTEVKAKPVEKVEPTANVDPLITEARKYKTAEEFVKAQGIEAWHGSKRKIEGDLSLKYAGEQGGDITKNGFTFSTKDVAEQYKQGLSHDELVKMWGEAETKKIEDRTTMLHGRINMKNPLTVDASGYDYKSKHYTDPKDGLRSRAFTEYIKQMEDGGHDGIIFKNVKDTFSGKEDSTVYFIKDAKQFKTEEQLTSIWNKAQEGKVKPPITNAPLREPERMPVDASTIKIVPSGDKQGGMYAVSWIDKNGETQVSARDWGFKEDAQVFADKLKSAIPVTKPPIAKNPKNLSELKAKQDRILLMQEGKKKKAIERAEVASKPITPAKTNAATFGEYAREIGYNFPIEVEKTAGYPTAKFKELNKKLLKKNNTSFEQLYAGFKALKTLSKEVPNETKTQTLLGSKSNLKLSTPTREANDENKQDIETLKGEIETDTGRKLGAGSIEEVLFVPKTDKQATGNEPSKQNEGMRDLNAQRGETNQREVQKIADVFGKKIVWVKINDPDIFFNGGVSDKIPNKIFINVDSTDPHLMVLGHELIHTMKTESPKLYSQLKDYLSPEIKSMDKFKQALDSARSKSGFNTKLEDSIIYEELISEFSGEQFTNKDFWNKLSEKNPTLFEKLLEIAKRIIDKITNTFNKNSNLISSSFFKDIQKSQKVLADVMDEYAKRTGKETGENSNLRLSVSEYIPDSLSSWFKQISTNSIPPSDISQANGTWETPASSTMNTLNYVLADRNIDLRDVTKSIEKTHGILTDQKNASLAETLFSGRLSSRIDDFVNNELHAVTKAMAKSGVSIAQIEEYVHARHAEEANNYLDSLPEDERKGDAGISTEDANAYLQSLDPALKEKYEKIALMLDKITHKNAQLLVDYGLESQETIDKWFSKYKHYVPLFREDIEERPGTGQGFTVAGSASKGRTGSERKVVHILSNIAMQRERTLTRGEKNRVSQSLVSLAENFPNEDFWKVIKIPRLSTFIAEGVEARIKPNVVVARVKDEKTGEIKHIGVQFNEKNERAARMASALKNMDMDTMGEILGNLGKITRYVSAINTQYNPVFGVTNFFRDMGTAAFNLSTTPIAGKQKTVLSNVLPAMKGIWQAVQGNESSEMAKMFKDFQLHGGQTGYRNLFVVSEDRAKDIERELKSLQAGKPRRYLSAFAKILSDYNTMSENSIRLSAYKVGIESGMTKDQAASMAKNLTVNFNKKGQIAGQAGALYAFFNASVQGAVRMYETLKGPMGRKIIAGGIILGATQAMMLAAAGFKDEEPPEFVKERNIIIPIGGKKYITFPMPLGFNVIPNVGRILAEITLGGGKNAGVKMSNLIGVIMETFNPMGSSGLSMQTVAPTFLDPFAALAENKDWTGKPIYREDFNALNPTPGTSRVKDSATVFGRGLAWAFNILTGGDKYTPGMFSPTPDQIDYLGGQITGGLGREIGKTSMMLESLYTGNELPTYRLPLTGRFYGSAEGQANESSKYYSNLEKLNIHEANIKGRIKDREPVGEYIRDNPEAKLWRMANTIENTIGKIKKRKEIARTPEAKKTYDKLITIQQKRLNDMMERIGG
jgi:hypothetical protein